MGPLTRQVRTRTVQVQAPVAPTAGKTAPNRTGTGSDAPTTGRVSGAATAASLALAGIVLVGIALVAIVWFDPPLWARAVWALITVASAGWFVACGHAGPRTPLRPSAPAGALGTTHVASAHDDASVAKDVAATNSIDQDINDQDIDAQDDVVQALVVASYALQMGDNGRARAAVDGALGRCRATLDALLRERAGRGAGRGHVRSAPTGSVTGRRPSGAASSGQRAGDHHATPSRRTGDGRRERHASVTRPTLHR